VPGAFLKIAELLRMKPEVIKTTLYEEALNNAFLIAVKRKYTKAIKVRIF
jgi:hypothetical protein